MTAYYNEFDPKAAAWLRQLIKNGDIGPGEVDERSIKDVTATDLRGFTQHHFFAGIGVWSYALRNAGWTDDRPVCTASLPCQPFSAAGAGRGKDDERHLLPHFLELTKECGFDTIFGEQVATAIKHGWLDDLQANMEREGYALGTCVLGAHSVNSPHQRQRLYWVANQSRVSNTSCIGQQGQREVARPINTAADKDREISGIINDDSLCGLGNAKHDGHFASEKPRSNETSILHSEERTDSTSKSQGTSTPSSIPSLTDNIEWFYCKDEKYRPIKSGIEPLVDGIARGVVYSGDTIYPNNTGLARAIRLKGYGNAIQADTAKEFISAYMDVTHD